MPFHVESTNAQRLRPYFEERRERILALTRKLCEIESPSGDGEGSRAVVNILLKAAWPLESGGRKDRQTLKVDRIPAPNGYGEHFRLEFREGNDTERTLLILGHTDTVHPRGSLAARPWREEGGRIYAPGIYDMKASCAIAVEAVIAMQKLGVRPRFPVVLLLTCDEESGSFSGRALVEEEARRAEYVLVLEPSAPGGVAKTARKGTGLFTLTVEGRAAHAGLEPEKGVNAVLELARQVERVAALVRPEVGTTVNVGTIRGGTHANVVPAEARAEVDVRFSTAEEARRLETAMNALTPFDSRTRLKVSGGINRPPLERTEASARLFEWAKQIAATVDFELKETSVGGASDGNFAAAVGATVLDGLGLEGDGAHAEHEHVNSDAIVGRAALIAALMATL